MSGVPGDPDLAPQQFSVGDLQVDLQQLRVSRGDSVIALPRLSFDLLVALARAAPAVLSFDDLMQQVWPGLVVGTDTISQRVKLLREALDDDPKQPRYIAGVRGRGYQCIATVAPIERRVAPAAEPAVPTAPVERRRDWRLPVLGCALLLIVGGLLWRASTSPSAAPDTSPAAEPVTVAVLPFANPGATEKNGLLAFGIAESVTHQLANLPSLSVIARTSSFAIERRGLDAQAMGRELGAAYLVEGSVQSEGDRIRITAQFIDTRTAKHLWSLQLDRKPADIFDVQDEIASRVVQALEVSVEPAARARMLRSGTGNIEAYLAYLQGSASLASWRAGQNTEAAARFNEALRLDPKFPRAHVMLARALMREAQFEGGPDRIGSAQRDALLHIEAALKLDPQLGAAYAERAQLLTYSDAPAAERDFRQALALTPSDARAYQGLAALLWENPSRRREAAGLLQRARDLDPLEPEHAVTQALYLYYGFSRTDDAIAILHRVLERDPHYLPALARIGEMLVISTPRTHEAIPYLQTALELDPQADWVRRMMIRAQMLIGNDDAARAYAADPASSAVNALTLAIRDGQVDEAARLARAAIEAGTLTGADQWAAILALRMEARRTGQYAAARTAIEALLGVGWNDHGDVQFPAQIGLWSDALGIADLLQRAGDLPRAERVRKAIDAAMDAEVANLGAASRWHVTGRALSAVLAGRDQEALDWLERSCALSLDCWFQLHRDPAFERLRSLPRFARLIAANQAARVREAAAPKNPDLQAASTNLQPSIMRGDR